MLLSRFFCVLIVLLSLLPLWGQAAVPALGKRAPHVRLKARLGDRVNLWEFDRWFMPGPFGYESDDGLKPLAHRYQLPASQLSDRAFLTRSLGGMDEVWGQFNQLTPRLAFSHNLSRVFPAELYKTHPEFFPMVGGQRMDPGSGRVNWNPDLGESAVAAWAADAASDYFAENPDAVSFALGVNDGLRFGESSATLGWVEPVRWFRERPDYSDLIFQFMNGVAEQLGSRWPQKYVGALAYYWTENTPSFALHPRVIPYLTADRSQFYDREFRREEMALQKKWGQIHLSDSRKKAQNSQKAVSTRDSTEGNGGNEGRLLASSGQQWVTATRSSSDNSSIVNRKSSLSHSSRLGLYDYIYGVGFLIPRIHTAYLAEHLKHARSVGFTDYYAEMYPNWGVDGPQPWLVAQLLMDPGQSADQLLTEYYARCFKAAAKPMRRFFETCETLWVNQSGASYWLKHFKNDSQASVFPSEVCRELRGLLDQAEHRAEEAGDAVVIERVRFVSDAFGLTERYVAFCEVRMELQERLLIAAKRRKNVQKEDHSVHDQVGEGVGTTKYTKNTNDDETDPVRQVGFNAPSSAEDRLTKKGAGFGDGALEAQSGSGLAVPLQESLERYQEARGEFVEYAEWVQQEHPLAFTRLEMEVFLRHDPGPTAEAVIAAETGDVGHKARPASKPLALRGAGFMPDNAQAVSTLNSQSSTFDLRPSILGWTGELQSGLEIAGLPYELELPWGWQSSVEPWQGLVAEFRPLEQAVGSGTVLRMKNHKLTSITKGYHAPTDDRACQLGGWGIGVDVRGKLSESAFLSLTLRPYDANMQALGPAVDTKLVTGGHEQWVRLEQYPVIPEGTRFLGLTVWCAHLQAEDWLEIGQPQVISILN